MTLTLNKLKLGFLFFVCGFVLNNRANVFATGTNISTDVLVVGGTVSGTSAAIEAARSGAHVVLIEAYPWLGGMLTSAGVSATDGNHMLPSGLWGEFRAHLCKHYGSAEALATGWVSNTQFEPHVGNSILSSMVNQESRIIRIHGYHIVKALLAGRKVTGAVFVNEAATDTITINATVSVDATEAGDLMALAGCKYYIGQDPRSLTGEAGAPGKATDIIQNLLNAQCWLMPYLDVTPDNPAFQAVQRIGLSGIMRGEGIIIDWANKTYFYPDQKLTKSELDRIVKILSGADLVPLDFKSIRTDKTTVNRKNALNSLLACLKGKVQLSANSLEYLNNKLPEVFRVSDNSLKEKISRQEMAVWIDVLFDPFHNYKSI